LPHTVRFAFPINVRFALSPDVRFALAPDVRFGGSGGWRLTTCVCVLRYLLTYVLRYLLTYVLRYLLTHAFGWTYIWAEGGPIPRSSGGGILEIWASADQILSPEPAGVGVPISIAKLADCNGESILQNACVDCEEKFSHQFLIKEIIPDAD